MTLETILLKNLHNHLVKEGIMVDETMEEKIEGLEEENYRREARDFQDAKSTEELIEGSNYIAFYEIVESIHATAVEKGFWDQERHPAELMMWGVSEISEVFERFMELPDASPPGKQHPAANMMLDIREIALRFDEFQKTGSGVVLEYGETWAPYQMVGDARAAEEVADVIIIMMDLAGGFGLPIMPALAEKMAKNEQRPHRHGGKHTQ